MPEVTSRHLRGTTELLLMFPLKSGFVQTSVRPLSFASRLRALLQATFALRLSLTERELGVAPGPIERLETILSTQWTVVEAERKLLVSVVFDRSWEEYVQTLVDEAGDSLDAFFFHCEGYTGFSGRDGHQQFSRWLRDHQIPCDLFYTAAPELTVDDLDCFKKLAAKEPTPLSAAALQVGSAAERAREVTTERAKREALASGKELKQFLEEQTLRRTFQALTALQDLAWMYPRAEETGAPPSRAENRKLTAREVFNAAVWNIVPFVDRAASVRSQAPQLEMWLEELAAQENREGPALRTQTAAWQRKPKPVLGDVQGNILTPYPYQHINVGCIALIRCEGPEQARGFLDEITRTKLTFERKAAHEPGELLTNLFLTYPGLVRLGLPESQLEQFPKEFREGPEPRAGLIGDAGKPNHPDYWELPIMNGNPQQQAGPQRVRLSSVDFVLCMQKAAAAPKTGEWTKDHPLAQEVAQLLGMGVQVLHVQPLLRDIPSDGKLREHFGLVESENGSQPIPDIELDDEFGSRAAQRESRDKVPLGELLLGYPDQRGPTESSIHENPLLDNGSFLVLRKLEQDVAAFKTFAAENAKALGIAEDDVIASIVGRNAEGNSLVTPNDASNEFDYENDKTGRVCPFSSHVRLANPRKPHHGRPPPRIMRRGFSYGTRYTSERDAGTSRGLMFMAYNSSIARQYEVLQRWLNAGNSTGLLSSQSDVLTGGAQSFDGPRWAHVASTEHRAVPLKVERPFVSVKWGMYLFAPSRTCLETLAKGATDPNDANDATTRTSALVTEGMRIIRALETLASTSRPAAREAWKQLIEEPTPLQRARSKAVWETIRTALDGELPTPYGILKAGRRQARDVLSDDGSKYSAHGYKERFRTTLGDHYLSWDPIDPATSQAPTYAAQAGAPREYFASITRQDAYDSAFALARDFLAQPQLPVAGQPERQEISIELLATAVTALWAQEWLGLLPADGLDDPDTARRFGRYRPPLAGLVIALNRFVLASKYSFFPFPERAVEREAQQAWPDERRQDLGVDPDAVLRRGAGTQPAATAHRARLAAAPNLQLALAGGIVGFAAPAIGATQSLMDQWIESGELWHLAAAQRPADVLPAAILRGLMRTPVPPILYREARTHAEHEHPSDENRVVVGLVSACDDEPGLVTDHEKWKWLFGGESGPPGENIEHHACPARSAALGFLMGVTSALLALPNLARERRLVLSFDRPLQSARNR